MPNFISQLRLKWYELLLGGFITILIGMGSYYVVKIRFLYRVVEFHHDLRNAEYNVSNIPNNIIPTHKLVPIKEYDQLRERVERLEELSVLIPVFERIFLQAEQEFQMYSDMYQRNLFAVQNNLDRGPEAGLYVNIMSPRIGFLSSVPIGTTVLVRATDNSTFYSMKVKGTFQNNIVDSGFRTQDVQLNVEGQKLVRLTSDIGLKSIVVKLESDPNALSPALYHFSNHRE